MEKLPKYTHENGIDYVLVGNYYIPMLTLPEEDRPIGRWGRMRREYLKECRPGYYSSLLLAGKLWAYLADLDEQAQGQLDIIIRQMVSAEGVTEGLKADDQLEWARKQHPKPGGGDHPRESDLCLNGCSLSGIVQQQEISRYAAVQELDEAVLNRLISRILVGEVKKVDGRKTQQIKIVYNFVGEIQEIAD